jgi:hypothetical protein
MKALKVIQNWKGKKAKPQAKGTQHLGLLTHCINTQGDTLGNKEHWAKNAKGYISNIPQHREALKGFK